MRLSSGPARPIAAGSLEMRCLIKDPYCIALPISDISIEFLKSKVCGHKNHVYWRISRLHCPIPRAHSRKETDQRNHLENFESSDDLYCRSRVPLY
ncbi:hypothetical protein RRG08_017022 [Elysia crispata]|uniref:Uncharacterized protein n=1 Tax=Elysia crispata TaxID=231223 RepID=A0AAE0XYX6_9GAST|nr:hypothetical protein RRG08_017022 [Elysia crispata]